MKTLPFCTSSALTALLRLCMAVILHLAVCIPHAKAGECMNFLPHPNNDSMVIKTLRNSKTHSICLTAAGNNGILFAEAIERKGKIYQLFLFDMDSKLVSRIQVLNKHVTFLEKPEKGIYFFEILSDDNHVGYGSMAVK